jgi:hypothetical protein
MRTISTPGLREAYVHCHTVDPVEIVDTVAEQGNPCIRSGSAVSHCLKLK